MALYALTEEPIVMRLPDGEIYRYVGPAECSRCGYWYPMFEDAVEVDLDGRVRAWSGIATADDDVCEMSHLDTWENAFSIRWPTSDTPSRAGGSA